MPKGDKGNGTILPFEPGVSGKTDSAIARIEAYWNELRAGRLVPSRSELDPRGLEGVLSHAFVLERVSKGLARLRIAGSHMGQFLGMEARGLPLSALFETASREPLADVLTAVFDEPAAVRLSVTSDAGFGRPELHGHMLLLPLRSDLGDITRVLGGVTLSGRIGRTPRRLRITGQSRRTLIGYADRPGETTGVSDKFIARSPVAPPVRQETKADSSRGHLRLVVVNDH